MMPNDRHDVNCAAGAPAEHTAAVATSPRPFLMSGSDGGCSRGCMMPRDAMVFAEPPERRRVGRYKRDPYHTPGPRRLSPEQEAVIRSRAGYRSLRALAAEVGVSHETVRTVLRSRTSAGATA